ncbi:MAG: response regulator [Planctomycetes bacterium]|nr:response regulator [Planctomycetota bacterium]
MNQKILLVDDDPNILQGFKRQLRKHFQVETAIGGKEGLEAVAKEGPFAVIVSDMQMPEMDGIQFLNAACQLAPESVRMMLTGNADQQTASNAVNEGRIFRFLTKPCAPETLIEAIEAGIKQYQLVTAERDLLSKTLSGSVSVLTEVLSLVNPAAFGQTTSIRRLVRQMCQELQVPNAWEIEIAAMLCQVGCVTVPEATLAKLSNGETLTDEELQTYQDHPQAGYNLISKIPRLRGAAEIIAYQQKCFNGSGMPNDEKQADQIPLGARILKLVIDVVQLIAAEKTTELTLRIIRDREGWYDPNLLDSLASVLGIKYVVNSVSISQLEEGMVLEEHVLSKQGDLLLTSGQEVTLSMCERLKKFLGTAKGVQEPIHVRCPLSQVECFDKS